MKTFNQEIRVYRLTNSAEETYFVPQLESRATRPQMAGYLSERGTLWTLVKRYKVSIPVPEVAPHGSLDGLLVEA